MALNSEFSIIERYFENLTVRRNDVVLGIGDDCALLNCPPNHELAVSIDTLVEGIHFLPGINPESLGYKCLAVGLSDLAAMGAKPTWFTLALTLPDHDETWLDTFSKGLADLAQQHDIQLVGGDTTRGPLTITIQVHGFVPEGKALRRDGAKVGDLIYVTGTLGDAGAALHILQNESDFQQLSDNDTQFFYRRLEQPTPRNSIGEYLISIAHSAIDVSDGLLADLGHVAEKSSVAACLDLTVLPLSSSMTKLSRSNAEALALSSGDDYELCFTIPAESKQQLENELGEQCTQIGIITEGKGLHHYQDGQKIELTGKGGYDHFSE